MARRGYRRPDTFWPSKGDILDDEDSGVTWEVKRGHTEYLEDDELKIRYILVVGRSSEVAGPIIDFFLTSDPDKWAEFLLGIDTMHLAKGGEYVDYMWDDERGGWLTGA